MLRTYQCSTAKPHMVYISAASVGKQQKWGKCFCSTLCSLPYTLPSSTRGKKKKKKRYTGGYQKPPHPVPSTHPFSTFPANICTLIATLFLTHCFLSVETHSHASLSLLSSYRLRMPSKTCDVTVESCFCAIASSLCLLTLLCSFH